MKEIPTAEELETMKSVAYQTWRATNQHSTNMLMLMCTLVFVATLGFDALTAIGGFIVECIIAYLIFHSNETYKDDRLEIWGIRKEV